MMKRIIIILPLLFCLLYSAQTVFAQNSNSKRDSLYQVLKQAKTPARQIEVWRKIGTDYSYSGQQDSFKYAGEQMLSPCAFQSSNVMASAADFPTSKLAVIPG